MTKLDFGTPTSSRPGIREALAEAGARDGHPALLLLHGPNTAGILDGKVENGKKNIIQAACDSRPGDFYKLAFKRWRALTEGQPDRFAVVQMDLAGRLMSHLGAFAGLETGVSLHHTYGMPMIAGSAVKGVARRHAEGLGLDPQTCAALFGHEADDEGPDHGGPARSAGGLAWHDAWWVPADIKPLVPEVITPHHGAYYSGRAREATDFDMPVPTQHLAVQGAFWFAIEGPGEWTAFARQLLVKTLSEGGIGAKTSSGYGFMTLGEAERRRQAAADEARDRAQHDALGPAAREMKALRVAFEKVIRPEPVGGQLFTRVKEVFKLALASEPAWTADERRALHDLIAANITQKVKREGKVDKWRKEELPRLLQS